MKRDMADMSAVERHAHWRDEAERLRKQRDALLDVLKRYGRHERYCAADDDSDSGCACGLRAAIGACHD